MMVMIRMMESNLDAMKCFLLQYVSAALALSFPLSCWQRPASQKSKEKKKSTISSKTLKTFEISNTHLLIQTLGLNSPLSTHMHAHTRTHTRPCGFTLGSNLGHCIWHKDTLWHRLQGLGNELMIPGDHHTTGLPPIATAGGQVRLSPP